jgi:hypothetical protein
MNFIAPEKSNIAVDMVASKLVKWGLTGVLSYGVFRAFGHKKDHIDADEIEDLQLDEVPLNPILAKNFSKLQMYRKLNDSLFRIIVIVCDHLLVLEKAVQESNTTDSGDQEHAFSLLSVAVTRLTEFVWVVKTELSSAHLTAVQMIVQSIVDELTKKYWNVMVACSRFDIDEVIERAPQDIRKWQRRQKKIRKRKQKNEKIH